MTRWGLVSTVRAPAADIARFAAHHLALGAAELHLYLDAPDPATIAMLSADPRITAVACDDAWWATRRRPRMAAHQLRQLHNATLSYRAVAGRLDWLGHIDVDEFLLAERPVAEALDALPPEAEFARILPAELLAPEPGAQPRHFKRAPRHMGVSRQVLQDIYPTFGMHLREGFLSHSAGKVFARPGRPGTRLGVHTLRRDGAALRTPFRLAHVLLGHAHAPSWDLFERHFEFRRTRGSYRPDRSSGGRLGRGDILALVHETEGMAGLRAFFDEVCRDHPELRARLDAHGLLHVHPLDPGPAAARLFGRAAA
ncbi:glycosyltransferase family 2 protein [Roseivivax isoporae]|uniref:Glycosyl transferase family 2 n=1 Tax=Roseivivax isoporae LMG 25204 TaxID=1449351 RepID=X7FBP3_9RHOB|nr:glycosyltransferase family 2 protein [Roseivivax isoporae]ETX29499.1 hypothetical protein RISW2_23470 [Roseivivax isoporae LMG 25204]